MPHPRVPKKNQRSKIVMVKLLPAEHRALGRLSAARRRGKHPVWSRSAIARYALIDHLDQLVPGWNA